MASDLPGDRCEGEGRRGLDRLAAPSTSPEVETGAPSGSDAEIENVRESPTTTVAERSAGTGAESTGARLVSATFTTAYETASRPSRVARSATTYVPALGKETEGVSPVASPKVPSPSRSHVAESTAPDVEPASANTAPSPAL